MKRSTESLLVAAMLVAVVLCVSHADAQKGGESSRKDGVVFLSMREIADFDGFDVESSSAGDVVGMTVVKKGGRRVALKQQGEPACAAGCPTGQKLSCWEEAAEQMSICVCAGGTERKLPGQKKYPNIVLKRGADTSR